MIEGERVAERALTEGVELMLGADGRVYYLHREPSPELRADVRAHIGDVCDYLAPGECRDCGLDLAALDGLSCYACTPLSPRYRAPAPPPREDPDETPIRYIRGRQVWHAIECGAFAPQPAVYLCHRGSTSSEGVRELPRGMGSHRLCMRCAAALVERELARLGLLPRAPR